MQYLLTKEELEKIHRDHKAEIKKLQGTIDQLCQRVADHEPVLWGWKKKSEDVPEPWGCLYSKGEDEWYCDSCPVQKECAMPQSVSP